MFLHKIFTDNTGKSAWTSITGFFVGSTAKAADETVQASDKLVHNILNVLQGLSFSVGIVVGILAIISWCNKNSKKK